MLRGDATRLHSVPRVPVVLSLLKPRRSERGSVSEREMQRTDVSYAPAGA